MINESALSLSALGKRLGLSRQAVHALAKRGMPTNTVEEAIAWRVQNIPTGRRRALPGVTTAKPASTDRSSATVEEELDLFGEAAAEHARQAALNDARVRKEAAQAALAEIEVGKAAGELLRADRVVSCIVKVVTELRLVLESLPMRLAPMLAHAGSEERVEAILHSEIESALQNCSDRLKLIEKEAAENA